MSSLSAQPEPFALSVMVPELETFPESVTSPVPRFCQVAPEETEATVPEPVVVRFEDEAPVPWENTPNVMEKDPVEVFVAPADPSNDTTLLGDVPVFAIVRVAKVVELEPPIV